MSSDNITRMGIKQLLRKFESRTLTAREVTELELQLIEADDPRLNTFLCLNKLAIEESMQADNKLGANTEPPALNGIPVSVKDLLLTRNMPTTGGSRAPLP
ncbi:MAG TPA: amidase family protein, partial [Acidobacteriota bacterium]|nr:amidase family protein [Acidobacteriota bacterium]